MFSAILGFLGGIFEPAAKLIDKSITSDQERLELRNALAQIQSDLYTKMIELEGKALEADAKIREAEAGSKYWLTANWRPVTSIVLVATILISAWMNKVLPDSVTQLAEVFLGVHAGGRSLEKVFKSVKLGK